MAHARTSYATRLVRQNAHRQYRPDRGTLGGSSTHRDYQMSTYNDAVLDHISWRVLLALAALGQSRVFLWRRVILFDHEFDRHAVKLLENESPIQAFVILP